MVTFPFASVSGDYSKRVYQGVRVKHTVKDLLAEKRSRQTSNSRLNVSADSIPAESCRSEASVKVPSLLSSFTWPHPLFCLLPLTVLKREDMLYLGHASEILWHFYSSLQGQSFLSEDTHVIVSRDLISDIKVCAWTFICYTLPIVLLAPFYKWFCFTSRIFCVLLFICYCSYDPGNRMCYSFMLCK